MGLIDQWFFNLTRPFREMKSKWMGIKNVKDGLQADVKRMKGYADQAKGQVADAKGKAKEALDKANAAKGQAQGAMGQAQGVWGQAQGQMQNFKGVPAAAGGKPGIAGAPGMMPGPAGPGAMPGMPGAPGMAAAPGMPGMPYGAAPGGYGQAFGGAQMAPMAQPGPGVRTMAIMAGGSTGAAIGWVVPLKGPNRGELITLKPQSVIGKDPTCDVVFNDAFLSGRHATIRAQNGVFVLEDHSTNGTWVNDKKISRHELVDNDFIKVGQTLMKFKLL